MELLVIILNREEYFEKIVSILVETGATGSTILDSEGLGHFLAYEVPIFAGLRKFVGEKKSANKTILAILENKNIFSRFKQLLAEEDINFAEDGVGVMITLPVNEVVKPKE
ncbi:MAG: hypothetical protein ABIH08_06195 [Candidatus Omnitrophota bacterium]